MVPSTDVRPFSPMFYGRLNELLVEWMSTGRFPREELRVRPLFAIAFAITVLGLAAAFVAHQLSG
jgi:hypothetical protein